MRTMIAKFCFGYGVLISVLGFSLMISGWTPLTITEQQALWIGLPLWIGYGLTVLFTYPFYNGDSKWEALFQVTDTRKRAARIAISLSILAFGALLLITVLTRMFSGPVSSSLMVRLIGSLLCLNGIYCVIHWAYRPENIFARRTLILMSNVTFAVLSSRYRRNAAKVR